MLDSVRSTHFEELRSPAGCEFSEHGCSCCTDENIQNSEKLHGVCVVLIWTPEWSLALCLCCLGGWNYARKQSVYRCETS